MAGGVVFRACPCLAVRERVKTFMRALCGGARPGRRLSDHEAWQNQQTAERGGTREVQRVVRESANENEERFYMGRRLWASTVPAPTG